MAWNAASDLVIGGGGQVYVADYVSASSPALPTTAVSAPAATYVGMGYLSEDGVTVSVTPEVVDFPVWQSRQPARRENQAQEILLSGQFAQWNENTVPVCYGKGVGDATSTTFAFPADTDALQTHSVIVDVTDGSENHRFHFQRANQTESVEVQFNRANLAVLPFGFKALAPEAGGSPGSYFTDSAGFAVGS